MTPESMSNHNQKTDALMEYVVGTFTNNTMLKFYEELGKIGMDSSGVVAPEITVNEDLFKDPGIQAACALEVRYDFGNSFFAHPSVKGNQQIKDAVMDVLENGSHADAFEEKKIEGASMVSSAPPIRVSEFLNSRSRISLENKTNPAVIGAAKNPVKDSALFSISCKEGLSPLT
jgi:hypothetical protein